MVSSPVHDNSSRPFTIFLIALATSVGCYKAMQDDTPPPDTALQLVNTSFYGEEFSGESTASGEPFDPAALTAAHKELAFGTILNVRNPKTGKSVRVRVNDRGPFVAGRDLDLSSGAAKKIGLTGVEPLEFEVVK